MKNITNEYQLSKTVRFGLTKAIKTRKEGFTGKIYESHRELSELVKISEERVKQSVSTE